MLKCNAMRAVEQLGLSSGSTSDLLPPAPKQFAVANNTPGSSSPDIQVLK